MLWEGLFRWEIPCNVKGPPVGQVYKLFISFSGRVRLVRWRFILETTGQSWPSCDLYLKMLFIATLLVYWRMCAYNQKFPKRALCFMELQHRIRIEKKEYRIRIYKEPALNYFCVIYKDKEESIILYWSMCCADMVMSYHSWTMVRDRIIV